MATFTRLSAVDILGGPKRPLLPSRGLYKRIVCKSQPSGNKAHGESSSAQKIQGAAAAALAASILLSSAAMPPDALAARSGGRVGGSSFRSAPRSAPSGPTVKNYTYNVQPSPPLIGGYGFGGGYGYGFGGGGISLFPTFVTPVGGGIFQFFIVAIIASTILGAVRAIFSSRRRNDDWD